MVDFGELELGDEEIKTLLATEGFAEAVSEIRKRWDIPQTGFTNGKQQTAWREKLSERDHEELWADIDNLCRDYGKGENWRHNLMWYVRSNNPRLLRNIPPWKMTVDEEGLNLKPYSEVTQKDLIAAHRAIKSIGGHKKAQPAYNFDRDYEIYQLSLDGKSASEIAVTMNKKPGNSMNTDDVSKAIRRMKERLSQGRSSST